MTTAERIQRLRTWAKAYYDGNPMVPDTVFDRERDQVEALAPKDPFFQDVGAPVERGIRHKIPMTSLAKCTSIPEFEKWYATLPKDTVLVCQPKLDGCSVSGDYESGNPVRYLTRGDGITGEDITENILVCRTFGILKLPETMKFTGSLRGEAVIHSSVFNATNFPSDDPEEEQSNRRNSVAGAIRRKEDTRRAKFIDLVFYDLAGLEFRTELEKIDYIQSLGLPTPPTYRISSLKEAKEIYQKYLNEREKYPYMIDGLVFKINEILLQQKMGVIGGRPRGMRALKFPALQGQSILRRVEQNVGHTGMVTLRAWYDPVVIDNRTFEHATLNNYDYIKDRDIHIGDTVLVEIGGDIIPKITAVVEPGKDRVSIPAPTECPICHHKVQQRGLRHYCENLDCDGKSLRIIRNWVGKVDIKFFGKVAQDKAFKSGLVTQIPDLYRLDEIELGKLIGPGNAQKVMKEIRDHMVLPLHIFIGSLGIPFLGRTNAQNLIGQGVDTLDKFLNLDTTKRYTGFADNLLEIKQGIDKNAQIIKELLELGVSIATEQPRRNDQTLSGKTFVITGTLSAPRKYFETLITDMGGHLQSAVSKSTNYLLAGEDCGSKLEKARTLGVQVISEEDFKKMSGN